MSVLKKLGSEKYTTISIRISEAKKKELADLKEDAKNLGFDIDIQTPAMKAILTTITKAKKEIKEIGETSKSE